MSLKVDPIFNDEYLNEVIFVIDSREQTPWDFSFLDSDKIKIVTETSALPTGDYSLYGYEHHLTIERKSLDDLVGCVGNGRNRFENELRRMRGFSSSAVVVEAPWDDVSLGNWRSKISPAAVVGSCIGWQQWKIPFHFARGPNDAALWAAKFLLMFHKRNVEAQKKTGKTAQDRRKVLLRAS